MNEDRLKSSQAAKQPHECSKFLHCIKQYSTKSATLLVYWATSRSDKLSQTTLKGIQSNAFIIIKSA
jgi:hypothetical protein